MILTNNGHNDDYANETAARRTGIRFLFPVALSEYLIAVICVDAVENGPFTFWG